MTDASLQYANHLDQRWRAEVVILAMIAPVAESRWSRAIEAGLTLDDFTFDDSRLIARALAVGHTHPRVLCAKLARNLLDDAGLYDDQDLRRFASGVRWGIGALARLFTYTADDWFDQHAFRRAIADVRSKPRFLEPTTRTEAA